GCRLALGQYYDQETGINQNYFRDLDPIMGSYVESDPIGLHGGLNTYAYVDGNPASKYDTVGLMGSGGGGTANHPLPCNCPKVPYAPLLCENIKKVKQHSLNPFWFYDQVHKYGAWDYKQMRRWLSCLVAARPV